MGPWVHGGWSRGDGDQLGDVHFNAKTGDFYREKIEFPFFEHHLKGEGADKHPEGVGLRDGHERVAEVRRLAAEGGEAQVDLLRRLSN